MQLGSRGRYGLERLPNAVFEIAIVDYTLSRQRSFFPLSLVFHQMFYRILESNRAHPRSVSFSKSHCRWLLP